MARSKRAYSAMRGELRERLRRRVSSLLEFFYSSIPSSARKTLRHRLSTRSAELDNLLRSTLVCYCIRYEEGDASKTPARQRPMPEPPAFLTHEVVDRAVATLVRQNSCFLQVTGALRRRLRFRETDNIEGPVIASVLNTNKRLPHGDGEANSWLEELTRNSAPLHVFQNRASHSMKVEPSVQKQNSFETTKQDSLKTPFFQSWYHHCFFVDPTSDTPVLASSPTNNGDITRAAGRIFGLLQDRQNQDNCLPVERIAKCHVVGGPEDFDLVQRFLSQESWWSCLLDRNVSDARGLSSGFPGQHVLNSVGKGTRAAVWLMNTVLYSPKFRLSCIAPPEKGQPLLKK
eukprot:755022-Hanusia_phi.AAC.3